MLIRMFNTDKINILNIQRACIPTFTRNKLYAYKYLILYLLVIPYYTVF